MRYVFFQLNLLFKLDTNGTYYVICPTFCNHCIPCLMCFNVLYIVLYENMLYIEVMYHFNEQVDFKISSKLIQASKGLN